MITISKSGEQISAQTDFLFFIQLNTYNIKIMFFDTLYLDVKFFTSHFIKNCGAQILYEIDLNIATFYNCKKWRFS